MLKFTTIEGVILDESDIGSVGSCDGVYKTVYKLKENTIWTI